MKKLSHSIDRPFRRYTFPELAQRESYPSVSEILNFGEGKPGLNAGAMPPALAQSLARGSAVHQAVAEFLDNGWCSLLRDSPAYPWWVQAHKFLCEFLQQSNYPLLVEGAVLSEKCYAGTLDLLYRSETGEFRVADWKTAKSSKVTPAKLRRWKQQLAAYTGAVNTTYRDEGVEVQTGEIFLISPDEVLQLRFTPSEMRLAWEDWLENSLYPFQKFQAKIQAKVKERGQTGELI